MKPVSPSWIAFGKVFWPQSQSLLLLDLLCALRHRLHLAWRGRRQLPFHRRQDRRPASGVWSPTPWQSALRIPGPLQEAQVREGYFDCTTHTHTHTHPTYKEPCGCLEAVRGLRGLVYAQCYVLMKLMKPLNSERKRQTKATMLSVALKKTVHPFVTL